VSVDDDIARLKEATRRCHEAAQEAKQARRDLRDSLRDAERLVTALKLAGGVLIRLELPDGG